MKNDKLDSNKEKINFGYPVTQLERIQSDCLNTATAIFFFEKFKILPHNFIKNVFFLTSYYLTKRKLTISCLKNDKKKLSEVYFSL